MDNHSSIEILHGDPQALVHIGKGAAGRKLVLCPKNIFLMGIQKAFFNTKKRFSKHSQFDYAGGTQGFLRPEGSCTPGLQILTVKGNSPRQPGSRSSSLLRRNGRSRTTADKASGTIHIHSAKIPLPYNKRIQTRPKANPARQKPLKAIRHPASGMVLSTYFQTSFIGYDPPNNCI